jgi:hypothetical protein
MAYKVERTIIVSSWVLMSLFLFRYVPKGRIREAQIVFFFHQAITWLFGLIVVETRLIEYPYRLFFRKSNKANFSFEYFIYPALSVFFNLHYPENRNATFKALYYLLHTSLITVFELFAVKYTKLIRYKNWNWYWSFITIWGTYYISHVHFRWFFKKRPL